MTGGGARRFQWTGPGELFYADLEAKVYTVSFKERTNGLELGTRHPLFGGRPLDGPAEFVAARDRFLVASPVAGEETRISLILVTGWQSGLKR